MVLFAPMATIISVESTNNIIQTLRYASMPLKLHARLVTAAEAQAKIENFTEKYNKI